MSESETEDTSSDEQADESESKSQEQTAESEQASESESEQESESESKQESESESESETETEAESSSESESDEASDTDETETTEPAAVETGETDAHKTIEGILAIRQSVEATAGSLIGHKFDGVSEIEATDDGWRSVVEVVERKSIPDTQDVIGRYEVDLDEEGVIEGYSRLNRYRRGDTTVFE